MRARFIAIALFSMLTVVWVTPPVTAQIPSLPNLQPPRIAISESDNRIVSNWVYLDGRRLFQVASSRTNIRERIGDIQQNLAQISQDYFRRPNAELNIDIRYPNDGLPTIFVNNDYLLTISEEDAKLRQVTPSTLATEIRQILQQELKQAKQERQPEVLIRQSGIAFGCLLLIGLASWIVYRWQRRLLQQRLQHIQPEQPTVQPITRQLTRQQHLNLKEAQQRLFQLAQTGIWVGGTLFIFDLFPYTRSLQLWILTTLEVPLQVGIIALGTYVAIRLSYALIDRFASVLASNTLLTPESSQRLQLRVSTISGVTKSIATVAFVGIGILLALPALGVDIGPLLAGAGLIGVAVSLASQNLIKDTINGFFILLEDQYALGDVIAVGDYGGLVENLNLRITQLRDAEGRLITIPNSEIKIVANLSSRWSRADLNIPVAYDANVDQALKLIQTVGLEMDGDVQWQEQIIEAPQVLGIDNFGDRGLIIRVWIKTQPLKQWDVAREYRRRLKIAFDNADIKIPIPQHAVWLQEQPTLKFQFDGRDSTSGRSYPPTRAEEVGEARNRDGVMDE